MLTFYRTGPRIYTITADEGGDEVECGEIFKTDGGKWKGKSSYFLDSAEHRQIADKLDKLNKENK